MLTLDGSEAGLAVFTGDISLADEKKLILGTNTDISLKYNETSTDTLMISSDVDDAALGIMTTDLSPKLPMEECKIGNSEVKIYGIAKGSGMIFPNMATTLGYVFTDANL